MVVLRMSIVLCEHKSSFQAAHSISSVFTLLKFTQIYLGFENNSEREIMIGHFAVIEIYTKGSECIHSKIYTKLTLWPK